MRRRRRGAEPDVTPLIDVLFMLIIFFVLTASFVQGRVEVDLPFGEGTPKRSTGTLLVSVTRDGKIAWGVQTASWDEIPALAAEAKAASRDLLVAGDRDAPYGVVAQLLDALRREGLSSAGLALEGGRAP